MTGIITIHEYLLKPDVDANEFEEAIKRAQKRNLFDLPGLSEYHFIKGCKGTRKGQYAAIWIYESREAWEAIWGSPENPKPKQDYPEKWKIWEDEILAPFLSEDPDEIRYTSYEELT